MTKDIPENVIAVGNPCRVLREITEADKTDNIKMGACTELPGFSEACIGTVINVLCVIGVAGIAMCIFAGVMRG